MQISPPPKNAPTNADGYVAAPLNTCRWIQKTRVDLHVQYDPDSTPVLFCQAGWALDPARLDELQEIGVSQLFLRSGDFLEFSSELLGSLDSLIHEEGVSQPEKFAAIQVAVAAEVDRALHVIDCRRYCEVADKVSKDLVELLAGNEVLPSDLFRLARHDFTTFTHVTNVASYSVILAERLGVSDRKVLSEIACGAMLHDIGKRFIPAEILTKEGRLSRQERETIEEHPRRGYEEVCQRDNLNHGQLMMVYQHHERMDGRGYPVGILGDEIHHWARLLAVVDVFDAITARRPYRQPMTWQDALAYQQQLSGSHFDPEMIQCWTSAMSTN